MVSCSRLIQDLRCWMILAALLLWFVMFPDDLQIVKNLFEVTKSVSLGVYIFASAVLVCWMWQRSRSNPL